MSIRTKMAKGAAWMIGFKLGEQLIGIVSMVILARLLVPADFGLVAMAMVIYALLELLGALGTDVVLIQRQDAGRELYDTAWTINAGVALFEGILLALLAYPASLFYDEPRLQAIMYVLAASMAVSGLRNIGIVAFRKELEFHKEFIYMFSRKLGGFLVTVPLAWYFRSYWALIAGMLATRIVDISLSYWMHPYRPRPCIKGWHEIYHFSKWLYINNFFIFSNQRLAEFLLGKIAGPTSVGYYSIGNEVGTLPMTALVAPINRAVFPGYAKLARDKIELARTYIDVLQAIAVVALPAGFGMAVTADLLVPLLLGDQWHEAIPVVQALAVVGAIGAMLTNAGYGYMALGKPYIVTWLMGIRLCLLVPAIYLGASMNGAVGAATGVLLTMLAYAPVEMAVAVHVLQLRISRLVGALVRPLIASGVMMVSCLMTKSLIVPTMSLMPATLIVVSIGTLSYIVVLLVTWHLIGRPPSLESKILHWLGARVSHDGVEAV